MHRPGHRLQQRDAGTRRWPSRRPSRASDTMRERAARGEAGMSHGKFWIVSFVAAVVFLVLTRWLIGNEYYFFAAYQVLQFIVLATAWNILGGYTGYTNFGTGAFFAVGAYTAVVLHKLTSLPVPVMMPVGGVLSRSPGFCRGYLALRLKG